jgi:SAM-dependent methyltransferase
MKARRSAKERLYPETAAGGFTRVDGTIEFYTRVNAILVPDMTVVDFGAGRGSAAMDDPVDYRRALRNLKGKVRRVVGIDIDPLVEQNPTVDEARVIGSDGRLPLADGSVHLILSDSTFEHLARPDLAVTEFVRVLQPGGWLCARTPNRWGYVALGARLIPQALHQRVLAALQPDRKKIDIFPTHYRLNDLRSLKRYFDGSTWEHYVYSHTAEPAYAADSVLLWRLMMFLGTITPNYFGATLMIFLRKR